MNYKGGPFVFLKNCSRGGAFCPGGAHFCPGARYVPYPIKLFEQNQTFFGDPIFQNFENHTFGWKKFDFQTFLAEKFDFGSQNLIDQTFQTFNFFSQKN